MLEGVYFHQIDSNFDEHSWKKLDRLEIKMKFPLPKGVQLSIFNSVKCAFDQIFALKESDVASTHD